VRDEFNNDNNNIYVDIVVVIVDKVSATYLDYPKVRRPYNNNNNIYVYIVVVIIVNVVNPEGGRERERERTQFLYSQAAERAAQLLLSGLRVHPLRE